MEACVAVEREIDKVRYQCCQTIRLLFMYGVQLKVQSHHILHFILEPINWSSTFCKTTYGFEIHVFRSSLNI
jgi:hypothetical protein